MLKRTQREEGVKRTRRDRHEDCSLSQNGYEVSRSYTSGRLSYSVGGASIAYSWGMGVVAHGSIKFPVNLQLPCATIPMLYENAILRKRKSASKRKGVPREKRKERNEARE